MKKLYKILFVCFLIQEIDVISFPTIQDAKVVMQDWAKRVSNNETFGSKVRAYHAYLNAKKVYTRTEEELQAFFKEREDRLKQLKAERDQKAYDLRCEKNRELKELRKEHEAEADQGFETSNNDNEFYNNCLHVLRDQEKKIEFDYQESIASLIQEYKQKENELTSIRNTLLKKQQEAWEEYYKIENPGVAHVAEIGTRGILSALLYNKCKWRWRAVPIEVEKPPYICFDSIAKKVPVRTVSKAYVCQLRIPMMRRFLAFCIPAIIFEPYIRREFWDRENEDVKKKLHELAIQEGVEVRVSGRRIELENDLSKQIEEIKSERLQCQKDYDARVEALRQERAQVLADIEKQLKEKDEHCSEIIQKKLRETVCKYDAKMKTLQSAHDKEANDLNKQLLQISQEKVALEKECNRIQAENKGLAKNLEDLENERGFWHKLTGQPWKKQRIDE